MPNANDPAGRFGSARRSCDGWTAGGASSKTRRLFGDELHAHLRKIASIVQIEKGTTIYRQGDQANAAFSVISGVVRVYRKAIDGSEYVNAFLLSNDLFGLAEDGKYMNSTKAITAVTAYQIPISALSSEIGREANLGFHVICELCHELRQAERHALLLARRQALPKLVMFLQLQERLQAARGEGTAEIYLPMNRSDIANYLGMSLPAASRAFRTLSTRNVIKTRDRRHVKVIDRFTFEKIASDPDKPPLN